jgi:hypothetical protein
LQQEKSAAKGRAFCVVVAIAFGVTRQFFSPSFPLILVTERESIGF